jgi:hypothetical protein
MKLFVELCNARESWLALDQTARRAFLSPVGKLMGSLEEHGVEIVAWGRNEDQTPERAPYDFFAVFNFPNGEAARDYERLFRAAGWYDYFEQVNFAGEVETYGAVTEALVAL